MPLKTHIKKVLVIGSGPIVIGQAAEFDYAGTQACKAIKEEGVEVILVNSNPATIMTDANMADKVYIEPLTLESITEIIAKERPDGLVPGLGGQTGLNMAVKLSEAGVLEKYGVELLGTPITAIKKAEDRDLFRQTMIEINEPVPESTIVNNLSEAIAFGEKIGYPIIVRPAYTLGGTGGGIANNQEELVEIAGLGLKVSLIGQVLLERSVAGWKEIEFEVMRDSNDNCIAICSMENFDPVGIHTGDSIVVAPTQTLNNKEFQMLRSASLKIIRTLEVEGGCNVQFALDPDSLNYIVIEVNPRVSRSSALASKATGYPIAKMAAKIAIGLTLPEIKNPVTSTSACFEPTIDYIVVKIPRWPFDKFGTAEKKLGTQMKATGEVMAIDRSFEGGLMKAIRSLETSAYSLKIPQASQWTDDELKNRLEVADDERLFAVAEAFERNWSIQLVNQLTKIDRWFLQKILGIVLMEKEIQAKDLSTEIVTAAKEKGFSDYHIAKLKGLQASDVRLFRKSNEILPVYKTVDTCAGEFPSETSYYYSTYEQENEVVVSDKKKIVVLGSGPIRIGQGIEFDYCSVHSAWALRDAGVESIVINNNPETVSTDFDTSDKLYFEPLALEDVLNIIDLENADGVVVQFGGQTAINLASGLAEHGIKIFGTSLESIDIAEDRKKFEQLLTKLKIPQSKGDTATQVQEAIDKASKIGYPVMVRPSYVIGGRAMEVVNSDQDLVNYMENAVKVSPKHPVLIDKYICGKEVEVDAISDGNSVLIPGIMEHIERAGVHSGDSMAVYPPQSLTVEETQQIVEYTKKIAEALKIEGLLNIQYVIENSKVYVLEVNPRASRTIPILSKVTGIPMVKIATEIMLGKKIKDFPYGEGLYPEISRVIVKAPVFSFEKMTKVDISLGPEMKSTGEVMGIDLNFANALSKAMVASGMTIPKEGQVLFSLADKDKNEGIEVAKIYSSLGFNLWATADTARILVDAGLQIDKVVCKEKGIEEIIGHLKNGEVQLVINTPTKGKLPERTGFKLRQVATNYRVPCLTNLDTATALAKVIKGKDAPMNYYSLQDMQQETFKAEG